MEQGPPTHAAPTSSTANQPPVNNPYENASLAPSLVGRSSAVWTQNQPAHYSNDNNRSGTGATRPRNPYERKQKVGNSGIAASNSMLVPRPQPPPPPPMNNPQIATNDTSSTSAAMPSIQAHQPNATKTATDSSSYENGIDWNAALSVIDGACPAAKRKATEAKPAIQPHRQASVGSSGADHASTSVSVAAVPTGPAASALTAASSIHAGPRNDFDDGGIDWSAVVDMGPLCHADGSSTKTNAHNAPGAKNKRQISSMAQGSETTQPQQQEKQKQHSAQNNPYSLASGIGRPSSWQSANSGIEIAQPRSSTGTGSTRQSTASSVNGRGVSATAASLPRDQFNVSAAAQSPRTHGAAAGATEAMASTTSSMRPSSAGNVRPSSASGRAQELPPLPPMLAYSPDRVAPVDDGRRAELIKKANISATLLNGWKLLPHQKSGVLRGLKMRRLVLAFDMGLGKTVSCCVQCTIVHVPRSEYI